MFRKFRILFYIKINWIVYIWKIKHFIWKNELDHLFLITIFVFHLELGLQNHSEIQSCSASDTQQIALSKPIGQSIYVCIPNRSYHLVWEACNEEFFLNHLYVTF